MSNYDNLSPKEYQSYKEAQQREIEYEEWRKILTIFIINGDINNNFSSRSDQWTTKPITEEQVRAVFSEGYRFAMLQCLQWLKAKEVDPTIEVVSKGKNQFEQFVELKINDSFGLHSIEGREQYTLSKKLIKDFNLLRDRDVLAWR